MEDPSTRPHVGAKNLWKQLNDNEPSAMMSRTCLATNGLMGAYAYTIEQQATFPDGSKGYKVTYKQDMGNKYFKTGVSRSYLVRYHLTNEQKKSVALAIFMEVSRLFESHQDSFPWTVITNSGYSAEDLVSNLLGFYIAIGEYSKEKVLKMCHPVSKDTSLKIWDRDGSVENIKNKKFNPALSKNTTNSDEVLDTGNSCSTDACHSEPKKFPPGFKKITPSKKGKYHMDFPKLGGSSCYRAGRSYKNPVF